MHRLIAALALSCACTDSGPAIPDVLPSSGRTYVIDSIRIGDTAAEASSVAVDLDGDGGADNGFGLVLSIVAGALGVSPDDAIAEALAGGDLIHLLMFAADDTGLSLDTGRLFLGADVDGDPSNNFDGEAEFAVRTDDRRDGAAFGLVGLNEVDLADGSLTIENVVFAPIRMPLVDARILGSFDSVGRFSGRIAGVMDAATLERLRASFAGAIANEAGEMCDPTQIPCCIPDSRGEIYLEVFDANRDCILEPFEITSSTLFEALSSPDIDLDGDYRRDGLSASFAITAVPARFTIP